MWQVLFFNQMLCDVFTNNPNNPYDIYGSHINVSI